MSVFSISIKTDKKLLRGLQVRSWGEDCSSLRLQRWQPEDTALHSIFLPLNKDDLSWRCYRFYVLNHSSLVSVSPPISFLLVLSVSLLSPPTQSLALHLYPPCCHTFSPSLLTLPFLALLHSFFPWLFWVPLSSLLPLLLLKGDAAHLTAAAVNRACLSPCVAATTAVNLVQTRCLFYSPALSQKQEKRKEIGQIRKQNASLVFFSMGVFHSSTIQWVKGVDGDKCVTLFFHNNTTRGGVDTPRSCFLTGIPPSLDWRQRSDLETL